MAEQNETIRIELLFECDGAPDIQWNVSSATIRDELNEPFTLIASLATDKMDAEPAKMLGQPAKLTMTRESTMRQLTGIVAEIREGSTHPEMITCAVTVRPALEALRHRVNTKIFQEKTVPEILEEVLNESLGAYSRSIDNRLSRTYLTCDYRVQFNESDFNFCERLMEEEGIVYWFNFDGDTEVMVLADASDEYDAIESIHESTITFTEYEGGVGGHEYMSDFHIASEVRPTKIATRHFDWNAPSVFHEGESSESAEGDVPNGASVDPEREVYEHDDKNLTFEPGATTYAGDKDDQVTIRREAQRYDARVGEGVSTVFAMKVAATFELVGHTRADLDGEYLVLGVEHQLGEGGLSYSNSIRCVPSDVSFRPSRQTPKPRITSIQTAIVVGPSGEEIHTDEHGRIKVQFHWDRLGSNDEYSSCWIRVMQPWSGAGWGFVFTPRIGMEVRVEFVNGDPDQPLVTGCLYNGENPPPYSLPDEKTKSTIKTESSLGGGGFNELRFEDKAGEEEIYTHAQKDYNEVVENDHNTLVHHDQTNTVDNNQTQEIGANQTEHVGANQEMTVDGDRTTHIVGNFSETVDGSETRSVSSGVTETIDAGETRTITGGMTEDISGGREQTIDGDSTETITGALDQTIVGGAKITTPATYDITAVGGLTINTPATITVIAPAGYTLLAPGGQTTIDNNFFKTGNSYHDDFRLKIGACMSKVDLCYGIALGSIHGFHLDTAGVKISGYAVAKDTRGVKMKADGCKLKQWAVSIITAGILVRS